MQTNEFRVRPVTRFVLTHYSADDEEQRSATRTVGEFPNVESAEEVGVALQALVPGSTLTTIDGRQAEYPPRALAAAMVVRIHVNQPAGDHKHFAIVKRGFDVETKAYFAETEPEAKEMKERAEREHGCEFRIFSAPVTDPMKLTRTQIEAQVARSASVARRL